MLGAGGAVGAWLLTVACSGAPQAAGMATAAPPPAAPGLPMVVSCEPHQRTLVRPTVVNGVAMSQVECVAAEASAITASPAPAPAFAATAPAPVVYRAPAPAPRVYQPIDDTQVVPVATRTAARPIPARQVVYDNERPASRERSVRSTKKSAVIIGSSAGVGAGVGAAVGGKKGALIGAAIGGGGAAIWDQVTRRKD
jgi:hypothetical protein